ncbi:alpha/beta fold hydrolase [Reyranella sp.]|uniref:alpha/beta fold hydrolase n=1 Tax=Reyranella sp. TaxID=1929291 RepID=UPI003D12E3F0
MTAIAEINGTATAYDMTGRGPALLLIHGAEGGRRMFDDFVRVLERDFTVVRYDQRDCGETRNSPTSATLEELASDAAAFLEKLGLAPAVVYGTSFGSRIAQLVAIRHPEVVRGLVLGSAWPLPLALPALNPAGIARMIELRAGLPGTAAEMAGMFVPPAFLQDHPALRDRLMAMGGSDPERAGRRRSVIADGSQASADAIGRPTLLIAGEEDRIVPASVTLGMAATIAGARTVALTGVGHATTLQVPDLVARHVLDFAGTLDG